MGSGIYSGIYPPNFNWGPGANIKTAYQITLLKTGDGTAAVSNPRPTEGQLFPRGVYSRQNT